MAMHMVGGCGQALISMVVEAFPRRPLAEVEACVGELLCTPAFNLYGRRRVAPLQTSVHPPPLHHAVKILV